MKEDEDIITKEHECYFITFRVTKYEHGQEGHYNDFRTSMQKMFWKRKNIEKKEEANNKAPRSRTSVHHALPLRPSCLLSQHRGLILDPLANMCLALMFLELYRYLPRGVWIRRIKTPNQKKETREPYQYQAPRGHISKPPPQAAVSNQPWVSTWTTASSKCFWDSGFHIYLTLTLLTTYTSFDQQRGSIPRTIHCLSLPLSPDFSLEQLNQILYPQTGDEAKRRKNIQKLFKYHLLVGACLAHMCLSGMWVVEMTTACMCPSRVHRLRAYVP